MGDIFKTKVGVPVRVAMMRNPAFVTIPMESIGEENLEKAGYVRLSEYIEVTFPPLQDKDVAVNMLNAIDVQEKAIRGEFQKKLDGLDLIRKNLLAIAHKPE